MLSSHSCFLCSHNPSQSPNNKRSFSVTPLISCWLSIFLFWEVWLQNVKQLYYRSQYMGLACFSKPWANISQNNVNSRSLFRCLICYKRTNIATCLQRRRTGGGFMGAMLPIDVFGYYNCVNFVYSRSTAGSTCCSDYRVDGRIPRSQ